jgi:hypothetical protein
MLQKLEYVVMCLRIYSKQYLYSNSNHQNDKNLYKSEGHSIDFLLLVVGGGVTLFLQPCINRRQNQ